MPSRMRHGLLISLVVVSLVVISSNTSYTDTTNYAYDELNRLIRVEYADGTKTVFTYDQAGNRSAVYDGQYTLAVGVVGDGTVTKNPDLPIYSAGTSVTLTAVNGLQTFSAWSGDLNGNTNPTPIVMNGNKSVTATFAGGWLQGWAYRKSVTLSRASGAVTNYQMKLLVGESSGATGENVDCNSHVLSTFDDLRFTTSEGTTLLDYWIESITGSSPNKLATVWIEFDSIGTDATTFYMYYGKADAASAANFDNTFIFGDDFSSTSLNTTRWPTLLGSPTYTINTTDHYLSITDMGTKSWNNKTHGFRGKSITLPAGYKVEPCYGTAGLTLWMANTTNALANLGLILEDASNNQVVIFEGQDAWVSNNYYTPILWVAPSSAWYGSYIYEAGYFYAKWRKVNGNIIMDSSLDNSTFTQRLSVANSTTADHFRINVFGYPGWYLTGCRIYAFKVRQFAATEPAWGSWGEEQAY